jgi:hypothetical protein
MFSKMFPCVNHPVRENILIDRVPCERLFYFFMFNRTSRGLAVARLFDMIELNFGNLTDLHESFPGGSILTSIGSLERAHLQSLLSHQCAAVVVKKFCEPIIATELCRRLLARDAAAGAHDTWTVATSKGMESSDVRAVGGTPFAIAMDIAQRDDQSLPRYFNTVDNEINWMRQVGSNLSSTLMPLDKLRLELDERCVRSRD